MILVSGSTGMLGAHLLYKLILEGNSVRALKRANSKLDIVKKIFSYYSSDYEALYSKIEWFESDVTDSEGVLIAMQGIESVYHIAGMVSFNPKDKEIMIRNNIKVTQNMVNAALVCNVKKFCHVSSVSALGDAAENELITEDTFRNPKGKFSGYSISKFLSELEVWRGITEGLNAVIVNPSVILGPGNWKSGSPSFFSTIGKGIKFYTEGVTGYVDVMDVVEIMLSLMASEIKNERFIVSSENLSYNQLFSNIAKALGVKKPTIRANSLMLAIAWRLEVLRSKLFGKSPVITKDTARSAQKISRFSSEKLVKAIQFKYTPINESVNRIALIYNNENKY